MNRPEPSRTRAQGTRVTLAKSGHEIIDACRAIVAEQQYAKINGVMVDLYTASAIVRVYDAINDANRARFIALPVARMGRIAFSVLD